jgi:hypothetical protein
MTDELLRKIQHVLDRRITNEKQVVGNFVKNGANWKTFIQLYCSIVSECPIVFTASKNKLKYIKQVELTGVSRFHKEWKSVDWRLTFHDGRTMNWGFVIF